MNFESNRHERYRKQGYWRDELIQNLIRDACIKYGDKVAVQDDIWALTFNELERYARDLAEEMRGHGYQQGDRIILHLASTPTFFIVFYGILKTGIIPILALPGHGEKELAALIKAAKPVAYIGEERIGGISVKQQLSKIDEFKNVNIHWVEKRRLIESQYSSKTEKSVCDDLNSDISADSVAFLLLSGGSTDVPKLIPKTHNEYELCVRLCSEEFSLDQDTVFLAVNPIAHTSTLGCPGVLGTLFAGGTTVIPTTIRPESCFALIDKFKVTFTCLVPPVVRLWTQYAKKTLQRLPDNVIVEVGSAKFSPAEALESVTYLGGRLTQWFGMGEGLLTRTKFDDSIEVKTTTQGSLICDADEVLIVDADGNLLAPGEIGELITRGPYTITNYWGEDGADSGSFTSDGFFRSGDLASLTIDGNLIIEGRIKDIINRAGEKISINDLEESVLQIEGVLEAAVVGIPDERYGEAIAVFCSVDAGKITTNVELRKEILSGKIAKFKCPDYVLILPQLPKTAVGKIDKRVLREKYSSSKTENIDV